MYFDFEDLRPETPTLDHPISAREAVLLTIILHLGLVILLLVWPNLPFVKAMYARQQQALEEQKRRERDDLKSHAQFVFAQPTLKIEKAPPKYRLSDQDARMRTREQPRNPKNDLPFSRGNTPENVITDGNPGPKQPAEPPAPPRGDQGATPSPDRPDALVLPNTPVATIARAEPNRTNPAQSPAYGVLSDAIRNVQRYAKGDSLQNVQGSGDFGPSIQFDSKGVDFGPWLRRFIAQIKRNWFIPYAAMALHGHVVLTFNVHRDGTISDLQVIKPSTVDAFTSSAANAIRGSNPTMPLPPEYPDDRCFFTVTFYINEIPPNGSQQ